MTPKQAFDNVMDRANRLLRVHDGLLDRRQRGIRADWKDSFCAIMHWPQTFEIERADGRDAIVVLRDGAKLTREDLAKENIDDLLRSCVVMGVSALDRYVHERVCKNIIQALRRPDLLKEQEEFCLPAFQAVKITQAVASARRAGTAIRPANEIRKQIQEILHSKPLQSWREIEYAFKLIGISQFGGQLQTAYGVGDLKVIKKQLSGIIIKRNLIVHEGDLKRHQRGGQTRKNGITRAFVHKSLEFLVTFVDRLETLHR